MSEVIPDPVLERHLQRQMIKYAVQMRMMCPLTGVVLDQRTAVAIETAEGKFLGVVAPEAWVDVEPTVRAKMPDVIARTWDNPTGRQE